MLIQKFLEASTYLNSHDKTYKENKDILLKTLIKLYQSDSKTVIKNILFILIQKRREVYFTLEVLNEIVKLNHCIGPEIIDVLLNIINSNDHQARPFIADILRELNKENHIIITSLVDSFAQISLHVLNDNRHFSNEARGLAAESLGKLNNKDDEIIQGLLKASKDPNIFVKVHARYALVRLKKYLFIPYDLLSINYTSHELVIIVADILIEVRDFDLVIRFLSQQLKRGIFQDDYKIIDKLLQLSRDNFDILQKLIHVLVKEDFKNLCYLFEAKDTTFERLFKSTLKKLQEEHIAVEAMKSIEFISVSKAVFQPKIKNRSIRQFEKIIKKDNDKEFEKLATATKNLSEMIDESGRTLLHLAAEYGAEKITGIILIFLDINIEIEDKQKQTPLFIAFKLKNWNIALILLQHCLKNGIKLKLESRSYLTGTMCYSAIESGNLKLVILLLEAAFEYVNHEFIEAYKGRNHPYLRHNFSKFLILARRAEKKDPDISSVFHMLHNLAISHLVYEESDNNYKVTRNMSLSFLDIAIQFSYSGQLQRWWAAGAIGALVKSDIYDNLARLKFSGSVLQFDVLYSLLKNLPDVNRVNEEGNSALHLIAPWGNETHIKLLLSLGADSNLCNKSGKIPSEMASSPEIANLILTYRKHKESLSNKPQLCPDEEKQNIAALNAPVSSFSQTATSRFFQPADTVDNNNQTHKSSKEEESSDDEEALDLKRKPPSPNE